MALLEVDRPPTSTTAHRGAQGHLADRREGRDRDADRLERRRQVDDAAHDLGHHAGRARGRSHFDGERIDARAGAQDRRRAASLQAPEGRRDLPAHDGARKPRPRAPHRRRGRGSRRTSSGSSSCSRACRSGAPEGGHDVRRRAADAGDRARADGPPDAADARRALDGARADPGPAHLRDIGEINRERRRRSCWSSRTRTRPSTPPAAATCSRPGRSRFRTTPPPCATTPRSRGPTSAHDRAGAIGATALYLLFAWLISARRPPRSPSARATASGSGSRSACCSRSWG